MIYSLKFKMTQNQNKGSNVKNWILFNFQCRAYQNATTILQLAMAHWKASSSNIHNLHCWLKKDLLHIYFPVRCSVLHHKDPTRDSQMQGGFDHWYFPCICCLTGLTGNCYNVTSSQGICNNVTSSSAMQVCKHGFTNMVSNVMTKWHFLWYNH